MHLDETLDNAGGDVGGVGTNAVGGDLGSGGIYHEPMMAT
jgi:hypothetical protein